MQRKDSFPIKTPFSEIPPSMARVVVICFIGLVVFGILLGDFANPHPGASGGGEDLNCYRRVVERVHGGQGYYEAAHQELRRLYPIQSVFNWRLPYLAWGMGWLPDLFWAQGLGILLSLGSIGLWLDLSRAFLPFPAAAAGALLLLGLPIYSFSQDLYLAHEFWAGTLITLSVLTYARGWRWASLSAALLALMIRELALLYVVVMLFLSIRDKKYRESAQWLVVIALFAGMMMIHAIHVQDYVGGSVGSIHSWITFGGWKFVLETCSMHPYLFLLPAWLTAVLVPLAMIGLLGWTDTLGTRIGFTVLFYMITFLFIGQSFNRYWGVMYVNLLPLGLLFAPAVIRDLFRSALKQPEGESVVSVKERCEKSA